MTQSDPRPGALPERPTEPPAPPPVSSGARPAADGDFTYGGTTRHVRGGEVAATHPEHGRCPHCPATKRGVAWHRVEVRSTSADGLETLDRAVEGDDTWVAASLRALADQLDPPKRPTRADALSAREMATGPGAAREAATRRPGSVVTALPPPLDGASARIAADMQRRRSAGGQDPMSFR